MFPGVYYDGKAVYVTEAVKLEKNFYTQKTYIRRAHISSSREDYLEMIAHLCEKCGYARISDVAQRLNVSVSSVSKTAVLLKEEGYINYEKYGVITLTEKGKAKGFYLLKRHDILNRFFCYVNSSADELDLTEQIEHYIDETTVQNLEKLLHKLIKN